MLNALLAAINPTTGLPYGFIPVFAVLCGLAAMGFNWLVHKNANQAKGMKKKTQRKATTHSSAGTETLLQTLPDDDAFDDFEYYGTDDRTQTVVFGTKHSLWSNGFYHRIRIRPGGDRGSAVTIETASKSYQLGPVVSKAHKTFVEAAEYAVERAASKAKA